MADSVPCPGKNWARGRLRPTPRNGRDRLRPVASITLRHQARATAALFVGDGITDEKALARLGGPDVGSPSRTNMAAFTRPRRDQESGGVQKFTLRTSNRAMKSGRSNSKAAGPARGGFSTLGIPPTPIVIRSA